MTVKDQIDEVLAKYLKAWDSKLTKELADICYKQFKNGQFGQTFGDKK